MYNMSYRNKFGIWDFWGLGVGGGRFPSTTYNFEFLGEHRGNRQELK